ncbi:unnamed protein product [Trichogramma brassicae]|uniref:Uncharacterized protein n=1 Tax=Trichogramma brassicae TaxID=86971 RepID=A0A6H5HWJ2_9HYME|nr:unnamed protein product [Trichogramma brassicae]
MQCVRTRFVEHFLRYQAVIVFATKSTPILITHLLASRWLLGVVDLTAMVRVALVPVVGSGDLLPCLVDKSDEAGSPEG